VNISGPAETFTSMAKMRDHAFRLPLVSVVVINCNYGRFLEEAIDSVFAQTYSATECIIVDNASTDETPAVLAAIHERYPQVMIIKRDVNDGQTAATLVGFAQSSGHYVIFLDADDVLLPHCVESHIYVHLSSRIHIGLTAGDMLQSLNGDIILGTGEAMNRYLRSGRGQRPHIWRPYRGEPGWHPTHLGENLSAKVRYVPPLCTKWVWSPSSGLCYRRDALALFADNEHLPHLWTATDMYFAQGIGGWCGSVLIDEPVFIYRLHGSNLFSQTAQLNRTLNYVPGGSGDYIDQAKALIVDQLIRRCARFSQNLLFKLYLIGLLFGLDTKEADQDLPRWAKRSSVAHRLVVHYEHFAAQFGHLTTRLMMLLFRVPLPVIWRCGRSDTGPARDA
jgi:glycosyltransferase involved in cell wall biosynthesis